ncbi:MAG: hypothetical protein NTW60_02575 [Candidatus Wolfebacteria bacterium]|nr:hypothetical protein [Candidatus Wolfebacteria bacterium]
MKSVKYILFSIVIIAAVGAGFLFFRSGKTMNFDLSGNATTTPSEVEHPKVDPNADIENQKPLPNPPSEIKALYLTAYSAGSSPKVDSIIELIKSTGTNAVVIDIKDYTGYISYDINIPEVIKYGAKEVKIPKVNSLIKKFHDNGIYVIARITMFQDPRLAKARPELAIQSKSKGTTWTDNKKLAWIDPASREAWDYEVGIAKDAASRGFDELNFDYVRFASDGNLSDMKFNFWDGKSPKHETIRNFFKYMRENLSGVKISVDLFGLATVNKDDLGIGQIIEDAYAYFDYVCPMVYPSHYAPGFLGYKNPALYPYEIMKYSLDAAMKRLDDYNKDAEPKTIQPATPTGTPTIIPALHEKSQAKLRPWIQDFDLGAKYDKTMIDKELKATYDSGISAGWLVWNPSNNYLKGNLPAN